MVDLVTGAVVPGHGDGRRPGVRRSLDGRVPDDRRARDASSTRASLELDAAVLRTPYPADAAREPLERALAQLRGELD